VRAIIVEGKPLEEFASHSIANLIRIFSGLSLLFLLK